MLNGERVVLRGMQREDLRRWWELMEDLEIAMLSSRDAPGPWAFEQAEKWFEKLGGRDDQVTFVIEVNAEVIGDCRLQEIDRHNRSCEVGIALGRDYWGQGYGQDALRVLVDYAFTHHHMHRVGLECLADDERAVGCYLKVGFVEEGRRRERDWVAGRYHDTLVMSILEEEWAKRRT